MDNEYITEAFANMGYGAEPPPALLDLAEKFRARKCACGPLELNMSDLAAVSFLYDLSAGRAASPLAAADHRGGAKK